MEKTNKFSWLINTAHGLGAAIVVYCTAISQGVDEKHSILIGVAALLTGSSADGISFYRNNKKEGN